MAVVKPTIKTNEMKPVSVPEGMIVTVDTREQSALFSKPPKGLMIVRDTLDTGDYSIRGMESMITIERKALSDFYGSIGGGRERFKRELERMKAHEWRGLLIEANEHSVLHPGYQTKLTTEQIRWTLVSIEMRYGLHVYYAHNHKDAERWVLDRLCYFYKLKRDV